MVLRLLLAMAIAFGMLFGAPGPGRAQLAPDGPPPLLRTYFDLPVKIDGQTLKFEAMEVRPRGPGPFPLAVVVHGKESGEKGRRGQTVLSMTAEAAAFARRGFVAVAAMRRGYGSSQGSYAESDGTCEATRYPQASLTGAKDVAAIVAAAAERPGVDRAHIVVAGESVGGIVALALGTMPPPGLRGVINFSGGRGFDPRTRVVCERDKLIDTIRAFGRSSRVPSLWVYAANDRVFDPTIAKEMHEAYVGTGGRGRLVIVPAVARNGHAIFAQGEIAWRGQVDAFLKQIGLTVPPATPPEPVPAKLGGKARLAYREYSASTFPFKAFAYAENGAFAFAASMRSIDEARRFALSNCQRSAPICDLVSQRIDIEDR